MNPNFLYFRRELSEKISKNLNKGKVIILYGPRRVGKTTLLKDFFRDENLPFLYLSCDQQRVSDQFVPDSLVLKNIIGKHKNIVLDEAQYLKNPGLILIVPSGNVPNT